MRTKVFRLTVFTAALVLTAAAVQLIAQANRPTQNEDVLGALLVEVRGLRAAMEQMASAGPRSQLALARLQLQEQRIGAMLRRIEAIRDNLAKVQADVALKQNEGARLELALKTGSMPAEEREALENHLRGLKIELVRPIAEVQRLTAEETSLASEINAEQTRWAEFNQRLEELERALTRR